MYARSIPCVYSVSRCLANNSDFRGLPIYLGTELLVKIGYTHLQFRAAKLTYFLTRLRTLVKHCCLVLFPTESLVMAC